ncbi:Predicted thioesterase [marine actinobacterium PHSC20C1]|nr:Predicted thioesterase [marine actinobacterium PHSC20C1]
MTNGGASQDVQVRWPDLDGLGHVNHSTVLAYLEVGRDATFRSRGIAGEDYVVRHCTIDYQGELRPSGAYVQYQCEELKLGNTSIRSLERLFNAEGRCVVEATFTLVMWDATARSSRELTAKERKSLADLTKEQQ